MVLNMQSKKFIFVVLAIVVVFSFVVVVPLFSLDVPPLRGRINDYANMISPGAKRILNEKLKALEDSDSTQVVILTIPSLKGDNLEEFSMRVVEKWKIGQKGLDNGVLLLVVKNDRKVRIEVGYGLEGRLTDLLAGRIIDYEIIPAFKAGNYDKGFIDGVNAIIAAVKGEYKASAKKPKSSKENNGAKYFPFFILILIVMVVGSRRRLLGGIIGAVFFPLLALLLLPFGSLLLILALLPIGFFGGMFLPLFFMSGFGGGMFFGGGGFGGRDSDDFFGGGGGFSGGGGGFGGGGASGSW